MRHSRRQPPHWLLRATGLHGTIITTALSNRWSSLRHRAENSSTPSMAFAKKRNVSSYDVAGAISDKEADEMLKLSTNLRADVEKWIRATRPELCKPKV
jgi:hypothetical protein